MLGTKPTPEMVRAGVDEFLSYGSEDLIYTEAEFIVSRIYEVMRAAEPANPWLMANNQSPLVVWQSRDEGQTWEQVGAE